MKKDSTFYNYAINYLDKITINYSGEFYKEIEDYQKQLMQEKKKYDGVATAETKQKELEVVELIKKGDYAQAQAKCVLEFPVLNRYALALENEKKGDHSMALQYWKDIPLDYNGPLSSEILKSVNTYSVEIQQLNQLLASYKAKQSIPQPRIGMTANEVSNSQWGKPTKVNKTTTAYGVTEQWVYSSGKYVYLDNGIVTAIQE